MEIGKVNTLTAARHTDFGYYLMDDAGEEVLMPNAYVADDFGIGQDIDVFIYKDSEDRIVASTLRPIIQLGEFDFLKVIEVNQVGAFLDWGLPKDLLVPFAEQTVKMEAGKRYLVGLIEDARTQRLVGSAHINRNLSKDIPTYQVGDEVSLLLWERTELGMRVVIDNLYSGLIFESDIHKPLHVGDRMPGYVNNVREDGKVDLRLSPIGYEKSIGAHTDELLEALHESGGFLPLTDKSSPDDINKTVGLSKKAFKKSLGSLYKQKLILLEKDGIRLVEGN